MFNTDFLQQIENYRNYIFGNRDSRAVYPAYFLPPDVETLECSEDANGE